MWRAFVCGLALAGCGGAPAPLVDGQEDAGEAPPPAAVGHFDAGRDARVAPAAPSGDDAAAPGDDATADSEVPDATTTEDAADSASPITQPDAVASVDSAPPVDAAPACGAPTDLWNNNADTCEPGSANTNTSYTCPACAPFLWLCPRPAAYSGLGITPHMVDDPGPFVQASGSEFATFGSCLPARACAWVTGQPATVWCEPIFLDPAHATWDHDPSHYPGLAGHVCSAAGATPGQFNC